MASSRLVSSLFYYSYSCDLKKDVQIKIGTLEGNVGKPSYQKLVEDPLLRFSGSYNGSNLYVECRLFCDGRRLCFPSRTSHKYMSTRLSWNEWLTLPIKFCDLPRKTQLAITIYDYLGSGERIPVGGTTIPLFGDDGIYLQGQHDLRVWRGLVADGSPETETPGIPQNSKDQMSRLTDLTKQHRNGRLPRMDWLDRLTFREIEVINEREKRESNFLYLMVELQMFSNSVQDHAVVYYEPNGDDQRNFLSVREIVRVPDFDLDMENLVESKHHRLVRSLRSGPVDRDLKPNAQTRDLLAGIVSSPPTQTMTSEEQDLVWKFRFYLSSQPRALTKFLKCVDWGLEDEVRQALDMMHRWAPMEAEDALELLGPTFTHPAVRKYAVARLSSADDEDLLLYLLQLVQALKYEDSDVIITSAEEEVAVAVDDESPSTLTPSGSGLVRERSVSSVSSGTEADSILDALQSTAQAKLTSGGSDEMDLATFLIYKGCSEPVFANYFYWYLLVECEDGGQSRNKDMYMAVMKNFKQQLHRRGEAGVPLKVMLKRQQQFIDALVEVMKLVNRESGNRKKKIEKLKQLLQEPTAPTAAAGGGGTSDVILTKIDPPLPFPIDPRIKVTGVVAETAHLYKSNLNPARLTLRTVDGSEHVTIFKHGDDLRQDQLILQMIELMDKLLRKENLDLKLTPYRTLATSPRHGLVEYKESLPIAEVVASDGTIQNYLRQHNPHPNAPYRIAPQVMDNYIKSCAGYSIITYLLGVGDRHLDNLMLMKNGCLFHIDFGYILGRDPKPLPVPIRISREMVDAMGDVHSDHYRQFKTLCFNSFLLLRRHANLILNLFSLMVNANIPDIALEPDKTVKKVQDKLHLELSDEAAVAHMQSVLDESVSAVMAQIVEQFHRLAQYMRK